MAHPLPGLVREVNRVRADLLVIGARGVGGAERLLLGSIADGALNRCRVPILLVR
jgi:nucleotide-binding universal stress UspA family protein